GIPEVVALQPPCFSVHLPPLGRRFDVDADPVQVEPTAVSPRAVVDTLTLGRLLPRCDHSHAVAAAEHEGAQVLGHGETIDAGNERRHAAARYLDLLDRERRLGFCAPVTSEESLDRR